jgi:hypothetical protein
MLVVVLTIDDASDENIHDRQAFRATRPAG